MNLMAPLATPGTEVNVRKTRAQCWMKLACCVGAFGVATGLVEGQQIGHAPIEVRVPQPPTAATGRRETSEAIQCSLVQQHEEVVYVRSTDDIVNAGMVFAPPKSQAKPIAIIWLHGWGVNFYSPTYVMIGRALAERGLTTISVNTRMHDLGTVAGHRFGKRLRGGAYWGVTSEGSLDLAAWVTFAAGQGFERVVLVGHSAGWSAVAAYQIQSHDPRVAGMVLASGAVQVQRPERDAALMAQATRLVEAGDGDDLIRLPNKSFPSYMSAATFLDLASVPPAVLDFFGLEVETPGVASLGKPILAFFGTRGDVGGPGGPRDCPRLREEVYGREHESGDHHDRQGGSHVHGGRGAGCAGYLRVD